MPKRKQSHFRPASLDQPTVYPLRARWTRLFKPRLPEVQETLRQAMRAIRTDFDPTIHIPREAGRTIDCPWPRTRTCVRAYHCYGYCHVIAAVVLDLARRVMPDHDWWLCHGEGHSIVIDTQCVIIDINGSHDEPYQVIEHVQKECFPSGVMFHDLDEYIFKHLHRFPFGEPRPMPDWVHRARHA